MFTCPRCGAVSHNLNDAREGYCGACHDWTGSRLLSSFVSGEIDKHAPHVQASTGEWALDEEGCLRCPVDDALVVPSPQWLGR